jgi:hypothetical protein
VAGGGSVAGVEDDTGAAGFEKNRFKAPNMVLARLEHCHTYRH